MAKDKKTTAAEDAEKRDEYNRGDFQKTDPVTGEPRGPTGGNWQSQEDLDNHAEQTASQNARAPKKSPEPKRAPTKAPRKAPKEKAGDEPDFG